MFAVDSNKTHVRWWLLFIHSMQPKKKQEGLYKTAGLTERQKASNIKMQEELKRLLTVQLYQKSYFEFFKAAVQVLEPNTIWDFNWHHEYLCDLLQTEAIRIKNNEPKTFDYNINIPPRTGKSLIVSVCYNAWVWGCIDATQSFLCVSHTDDLAVELATKTKQLIESDWYTYHFPHVQLRADSQAKSNFKNTKGGSRVSFSMGGGGTGFGGTYLILDDVHKPNQSSPIFLETVVKNYRETFFNRLNNPRIGIRINIGQRISEGDLSGYIISNNVNDKYKNICLPIELTDDVQPIELRDKYVNNCFWYSRFPPESFSDLTDSEMVFATQYLQKPAPVAGNIIKKNWFDIIDALPDINLTYHFFIDTAESSTKKNRDASTIMVCAVYNNLIYVKDVIECYLEFVDLKRKIIEVVNLYGNHSSKVYIEPKSNGKAIVSSLKEETLLNLIELPAPRESKTIRLTAITPKLESRRVVFLNSTWNESVLYQYSTFPNAKADGCIDVLIYAVNTLLNQTVNTLRWHYV